LWTVVFPLLGFLTGAPLFGMAKPVPVNSLNWRDKVKANIAVSAAGPIANVLIAIVALVVLKVLIYMQPDFGKYNEGVVSILYIAITTNVGLAVFNMIPIPPLDGSHILSSILSVVSPDLEDSYERLRPYGMY